MKITISDINIDTSSPDYEGCFDFRDILYRAVDDVKRSLHCELQEALRREVLKDDVVQKFMEKRKREMLRGLEKATEDM